MNQKILHKVFIWGFLFLYLLVALISFCHAVQFFGIGNVKWMSIALAFSFELGLALSLASILLSDKNKKQSLPWILMITLTAIQVIGNVYSVFRYISLSEVDYYQYLAKPLLFFIQEVDENTIQVIVSWIMGAILPIVALMMTDMVANNIKNVAAEKEESKELPNHEKTEGDEKIIKKEDEEIDEISKSTEPNKIIDIPKVDDIPAIASKEPEETIVNKNELDKTPKTAPVTVEEVKENLNSIKKEVPTVNYNDVLKATEEKKEEKILAEKKDKDNTESLSDYIDVLSTPAKPKEPIVKEHKEELPVENKEEMKISAPKPISKEEKPVVINAPKVDPEHLEVRKASESYFRSPTKKI